jgi:hypothetical protein
VTVADGMKESTMSNGQMAPETKGVTVKLLSTVDLGPRAWQGASFECAL